MKKTFILFLLIALPVLVMAQDTLTVTPAVKFGYFSYTEVLNSMPDNAIVKQGLDKLRQNYDAETKRAEDEFNAKYEDFLDGQRDFAPIILQKRQAELQDLLKKNLAFKAEAQRLLEQAKNDAYAPLRAKLDAALQRVGKEKGFAFILNTDNNACPFVNPAMGEDVTALLKEYTK